MKTSQPLARSSIIISKELPLVVLEILFFTKLSSSIFKHWSKFSLFNHMQDVVLNTFCQVTNFSGMYM